MDPRRHFLWIISYRCFTFCLAAATVENGSTAERFAPFITKHPSATDILFQATEGELEGGKPFLIECEAKGNPKPIYSWFKSGTEFHWKNHGDRVYQQSGNGTLIFAFPREEDAGEYECYAENELGAAISRSVQVRKVESDRLAAIQNIRLVEAKEGEPFKLKCGHLEGHCKPKIFWNLVHYVRGISSLNSSRITAGPTGDLWFSHVTQEDASKESFYSCVAFYLSPTGNKSNTEIYALQVIPMNGSVYQPRLQPVAQYMTNDTIVARKGDDVKIWCVVGGTPAPNIIWTKADGTLLSPYRVKYENFGKTLRIKNAQLRDAGTYVCNATNGVGTPLLHSFVLEVHERFHGKFDGKILAIVVPPRRERTNLNWTGLAVDDSGVSFSSKSVNDFEGTLEWEQDGERIHKLLWAFELGVTGQLIWTLNTVDLASTLESPCERVSLAVLEISEDGNVSEIEKTCVGSSTGSLMSESSSQVLIRLHVKSSREARSNLKVSWRHHGEPLKLNVQGLLTGTDGSGAFSIPFNSTQIRPVSSGYIYGLAFDWNSRRIYKSQRGVGIMRSNLDGSESETLLSVSSSPLVGIAIEPIGGNLYYGNRTSRTIRVCSNDGTKCSLIANCSDLETVGDIAIHSSKGLLFWSIFHTKVVRANLDGSNATVILEGLTVQGIDVDEQEDRLYWGSARGIWSCDLNGRDIHMLPNLSTDVVDVTIHEDKVYFSNYNTDSIRVISKSGMNLSLVTKLTGDPYHIALFGTRVSNPPPNPCEKSKCAHLCAVMSPSSFQCMCPETKTSNGDGRTCQL